MRVLSWNIDCKAGGRSRVGAIAEAIGRHDPDVVALQEVSVGQDFPDALASALAERGLVGCEIGLPPAGGKRYANAIAAKWKVHSPNIGLPADDESGRWSHLVFSAQVTPPAGAEIQVFSVHMPNGSGNGWAKIDAFEALAVAVDLRTTRACVVAGDFNEPFRFTADAVVSFAYRHGEQPDQLWRRRGKHTPAREYPRRKWQDAVGRVLDLDSDLGVRRLPPEDGSYEWASHVTKGGSRLFDHVLVSEGFQSPGVTYDTSVLGGAGEQHRLSDHAIVVADLSIGSAQAPESGAYTSP